MKLNIILDNAKLYDVQSQLDVVKGETLTLEPDGNEEVFSNNDQVLDIDGDTITAANVGTVTLRFMSGTTVVKDVTINVVTTTGEQTTDLHGKLGTPVPKKNK